MPTTVYAATPTYARADVRNAYFFTEKSTSHALFAVPYTYCIEVISEDGDWYYARYAQDAGLYRAVYGYCRKQDFNIETEVPEVTYLYKTVTVNFSVKGGSSSLPVLNEIALEAAYYGTYDAGATVYSYVYCQGSFGYIEGANDDYELNLPKEDVPTDGSGTSGDGKPEAPTVNVGLIILCVVFAAAVIIILIIHFTTRRPKSE